MVKACRVSEWLCGGRGYGYGYRDIGTEAGYTITVAQIAERRWHPIYAAIPPHHRVHDGLHLCLSHVGPKGIPRTPTAGRSPCQAILLGQGERKTEGKHEEDNPVLAIFEAMHVRGGRFLTYRIGLRPGILVVHRMPSRASAAARGAAPESGAEPSSLAAAVPAPRPEQLWLGPGSARRCFPSRHIPESHTQRHSPRYALGTDLNPLSGLETHSHSEFIRCPLPALSAECVNVFSVM